MARSRQVCRAWKLLIDNSPPLKRRLMRASAGQQAAAKAAARNNLEASRRHQQFERRFSTRASGIAEHEAQSGVMRVESWRPQQASWTSG
jgi:hypothetical protein